MVEAWQPLNAPPTAMDGANQFQQNQDLSAVRNMQAATGINDLQAKQRAMQASMINAAVNSADPATALKNIIPIANRLNPSYQYDPEMDPATARIAALGTLPVGEQPAYQLASQQALMLNALRQKLAGGDQQPDQNSPPQAGGAPGGASNVTSPQPGGGIGTDAMNLMAVVNPAAANALSTVQKNTYESPTGKAATETATGTAKNILEAQKGVNGIDSRLQNAVNILNDQIKLAPKTYSGESGQLNQRIDRNIYKSSPSLPAQTDFDQNNANLFTQELPSIIASMPGSRLDVPLVKSIKEASQIYEYAAPSEKIEAAQHLKGLLYKLQQNSHAYAESLGAPSIPIPKINDPNPPPPHAVTAATQKLNGGQGIPTGTDISSPAAIKAAFDAHKITREQAKKLLTATHGFN